MVDNFALHMSIVSASILNIRGVNLYGMKNHNHDLVQQLSEDLDSLWRYKTYLRNAKGCSRCVAMWKKFVKVDEEKVQMLRDEVFRHVKERRFD